ncbi:MAG: hypothetical protein HZB55_21210 [Deltaproteobacteria bacterium]|nr:hypothetical protein [Deltaproteobacteria bacterium]
MRTALRLAAFAVATSSLLLACGGGTTGGDETPASEDRIDLYANRIQPILDSRCGGAACHSTARGGYVFEGAPYASLLSQGAVIPRDPAGSPLYEAMAAGRMTSKGPTPAEMALIESWIRDGAPQYGKADELPEPDPPPQPVGVNVCADYCHGVQRGAWLAGPHGNLEAVGPDHKPLDLGLDAVGFPSYGYGGLGTDPTCTTDCHDPLGDGRLLTWGLTGNVARPVIGCESCHGGGSRHANAPLTAPPSARPDAARCGACHNDAFDHNLYHPEADHIVEDYRESLHATSLNEHVYAEGSTTDVRARCSKCHTDEGAKRYRGVSGGHDALEEALPDALPAVAGATPVQCRTCHDRHDPGTLLLPATAEASAEYRTCTACHQTGDAYHGEQSGYSWSGSTVGSGTFAGDRILYDTHRDDPATPDVIEGYAVDPKSERACRACHNVHSADLSIPRQWARSAHGGRLLDAKDEAAKTEGAAAVFTAGVTKATAAAWTNYDWDHTFKKDGTDADALPDKDRADCQRCHTATGVKNFLTAQASTNDADATNDVRYDPADNDFSHLAGWALHNDTDGATAASGQNELLYCWGCHRDTAGGLRKPGALSFTFTNGASVAYPDVAGSGVCLACHSGRETGESIERDAADFADKSFLNSHYLAAGGTVFRKTGFEFYGSDGDHGAKYGNASYFKHELIGSAAAPGTGENGPCVGCHMSSAQSHLFLPVEKEQATGRIAGVAASVCIACHDGTHGPAFVAVGGDEAKVAAAAEFLQGEAEAYEAALDALREALANKGYSFFEAHPYFYIGPYVQGYAEASAAPHCASNLPVKNWNTGGASLFTWDAATKSCVSAVQDVGAQGTGKRNMGAAFNYNLLKHDPGAYAHNRLYAKRLIFDSIDWLDNNALDGVVDLSGHDEAYEYLVNRNPDGSPAGSIDAAPRP